MKKLFAISFLCLLGACQNAGTSTQLNLDEQKSKIRDISQELNTKGNKTAAANIQADLVALEPKDINSFKNLSKELKKSGHPAEALSLLETGEFLNPTSEEIKLEVAKALIDNNKPKEAIDKLLSIKTLKNRYYYNTLGVAYDKIGDHKNAQTSFQDGLKADPNDGLLLNNLALSYVMDKEYDKGIEILEKLVNSPNARPEYTHNLALAYGVAAKPDKARALLSKFMSTKEVTENLNYYQQIRAGQ